jgi:hypothetical protein
MKSPKHVLTGICILFLFIGCTAKTIKTVDVGNPENCKNKLLIAVQESRFKNAIVEKMTSDLRPDCCFLRRIDVADLESESDKNYEAVVIINKMKWMKINDTVKDYLSSVSDKAKFVVLTTTGKKGRIAEITGFDALSSASTSREKADQLAVAMSATVRRLFQPPGAVDSN